jgi:hypothetical protein
MSISVVGCALADLRHAKTLKTTSIYPASMKTYIDMIFNPDSADPGEVLMDMKKIGLTPIFGVHDFVIVWESEDQFREKFKEVKDSLKKLKVSYRLITLEDLQEFKCPYM